MVARCPEYDMILRVYSIQASQTVYNVRRTKELKHQASGSHTHSAYAHCMVWSIESPRGGWLRGVGGLRLGGVVVCVRACVHTRVCERAHVRERGRKRKGRWRRGAIIHMEHQQVSLSFKCALVPTSKNL
jgi:hypothetical protein